MLNLRHLLTGEELSVDDFSHLLELAISLKKSEGCSIWSRALQGKYLALLFDKPSLRTRFSFTGAMKQLGGEVIESVEQTRQSETPKDLAHVLSGYCDGIVMRTHEDEIIQEMASVSEIPILNGLSDLHHPCQVYSDLLTLNEVFGGVKGLTLSYIGDGNNVLHSLLLLLPRMGVNVHYCCPPTRQPAQFILDKAQCNLNHQAGAIKSFEYPIEAVANVDAVYTDKWTSMGFETQAADHLFEGFQINETLMSYAKRDAIFMHCMPMERGKEVSQTLPDSHASVIFRQSENRLHMQKSLLLHCLGGV